MKRLALTFALLLAASGLVWGAAARIHREGSAPPAPPTKTQIEAARKAGTVHVRMTTTKGVIMLDLNGKAAPITVANFVNLVKGGFYRNMPVHRVEPGFVIQAGDPLRAGKPEVKYTIPDEKSPLKHAKGVIAMARTYAAGRMIPNSASTQFYITLAPTPHLDRLGFTVFGRVTKGMDVVQKITTEDRIEKAELVKR